MSRRQRGTGTVFRPEGSSVWWIQYYQNGIRQRESAETTDRREALDILKRRLAEINTGNIAGTDARRVRIADLAEDFLRDYRINGKSSEADADAQAFKRACSCFGLGRYLYRFGGTRVRLNSRGEPVTIPTLPEWALPPGMTMAQSNALAGDTRGPVDQRLTAEIERFRGTLGLPIYAEILRRAGHSANARTIPNAERQKQTIEKMQAAARGFERLRQLAELAGEAQFFAVAERFKIASVPELPSLAALKQLVEELESVTNQQVA